MRMLFFVFFIFLYTSIVAGIINEVDAIIYAYGDVFPVRHVDCCYCEVTYRSKSSILLGMHPLH